MTKLSLKQKISFYPHLPIWKRIYHLILREVAKFWLKLNPKVKIIAITGSFGKTYTVYLLTSFLKNIVPTIATDLNLDTIFNLPLTILKIRKIHRWAVFEIGVDHKNEMDFHLDLFKPDIVVFTGISPVHSEKDLLGSKEGIKKEKGKLILSLTKNGLLIYNFDDPDVKEMIQNCPARKISYSLFNKKADYFSKKYLLKPSGTDFWLFSNLSQKTIRIKSKLFGVHFAHQFAIVFALAENQKIDPKIIEKLALTTKPLSGRMSLEKFINNSYLLNDRLRANPASTQAGLRTVKELRKFFKRTIIIMGEMGELGKRAEIEHQKIGKIINQEIQPNFFIGIGPLTANIVDEITNKNTKSFFCRHPLQAAKLLETKINLSQGDLIYIKASLFRHLERVELKLEGVNVNCKVISCPFYNACENCQYLTTGYSG